MRSGTPSPFSSYQLRGNTDSSHYAPAAAPPPSEAISRAKIWSTTTFRSSWPTNSPLRRAIKLSLVKLVLRRHGGRLRHRVSGDRDQVDRGAGQDPSGWQGGVCEGSPDGIFLLLTAPPRLAGPEARTVK